MEVQHSTLHSTMSLLLPSNLYDVLDVLYFTFHYVSITTKALVNSSQLKFSFTFHYVSITTAGQMEADPAAGVFTFHYVSITTESFGGNVSGVATLHSTMSLLLLPAKLLLEYK